MWAVQNKQFDTRDTTEKGIVSFSQSETCFIFDAHFVNQFWIWGAAISSLYRSPKMPHCFSALSPNYASHLLHRLLLVWMFPAPRNQTVSLVFGQPELSWMPESLTFTPTVCHSPKIPHLPLPCTQWRTLDWMKHCATCITAPPMISAVKHRLKHFQCSSRLTYFV